MVAVRKRRCRLYELTRYTGSIACARVQQHEQEGKQQGEKGVRLYCLRGREVRNSKDKTGSAAAGGRRASREPRAAG